MSSLRYSLRAPARLLMPTCLECLLRVRQSVTHTATDERPARDPTPGSPYDVKGWPRQQPPRCRLSMLQTINPSERATTLPRSVNARCLGHGRRVCAVQGASTAKQADARPRRDEPRQPTSRHGRSPPRPPPRSLPTAVLPLLSPAQPCPAFSRLHQPPQTRLRQARAMQPGAVPHRADARPPRLHAPPLEPRTPAPPPLAHCSGCLPLCTGAAAPSPPPPLP